MLILPTHWDGLSVSGWAPTCASLSCRFGRPQGADLGVDVQRGSGENRPNGEGWAPSAMLKLCSLGLAVPEGLNHQNTLPRGLLGCPWQRGVSWSSSSMTAWWPILRSPQARVCDRGRQRPPSRRSGGVPFAGQGRGPLRALSFSLPVLTGNHVAKGSASSSLCGGPAGPINRQTYECPSGWMDARAFLNMGWSSLSGLSNRFTACCHARPGAV